MSIKALVTLLVVCLLAAAGYGYVHWDMFSPTIIAEKKRMIDTLFAKPKSQCIGRYVFEVPDSFTLTPTDSDSVTVNINDSSINSKRLYRPAFEQRIRLREQELKNAKTVDAIDLPFLKQVYPLDNMDGVIFDRNKNGSAAGFGRILEGHLYTNGVAFIVTTEITDLSDDKYKEDRDVYIRTGTPQNMLSTKPQKLAEMQDLLSRLRGRKEDEIPTQPGTCIPDGFIADNGKKNKEKILFVYENSDFYLAVDNNNTLPRDISLLERGEEIEAAVRKTLSSTLRKGKINLSGIPAEEWLIKSRQEVRNAQIDYYQFTLYGNEKIADYQHPIFSIELHNTGKVSTTYNDMQLVDIWDRITRTFRPRPGAF